MTYEDKVRVIHWVITQTGSNAGERLDPGSKARGQAHYIAQILEAFDKAEEALKNLGEDTPMVNQYVKLTLADYIQ